MVMLALQKSTTANHDINEREHMTESMCVDDLFSAGVGTENEKSGMKLP
jgi:hypothetical protein